MFNSNTMTKKNVILFFFIRIFCLLIIIRAEIHLLSMIKGDDHSSINIEYQNLGIFMLVKNNVEE